MHEWINNSYTMTSFSLSPESPIISQPRWRDNVQENVLI